MSTYLGFDFGERRIGVAAGEAITRQARPLPALPNDWPKVLQTITQWQPAACVVGLPLDLDGTDQPITKRARRFAGRIAHETRLPVHLCDERMSSAAATSMMRAERASSRQARRTRRGEVDSRAACLILQQWLDGDIGD